MTLAASDRHGDDLAALVEGLELIDHHCHAVIDHDLDRPAFERLLGETNLPAPAGCSTFDTSLGLALRAWCAPLLDLPAGVDAATYLERRVELGAGEVSARMLAGGARRLLVDSGYRSDELASLAQLARWAKGEVHEIVRLETMAETVAASIAGRGVGGAAAYADGFAEAAARQSAALGRCPTLVTAARPC